MFFLSLIWAWTAYNLYSPHRGKPEALAVTSFLLGLLVGEFALHVIALEVALTLLFVSADELSGLGDALGLAIAMASWVAIGLFYFRGQRAAPVMEQAVRYGLAVPADAPLPSPPADTPPLTLHEPTLKRLVNPFAFSPPGVTVKRNVVYHHEQGRPLHVDIYSPAEKPENAPVLLQIHGGAWLERLGSKEQQGRPLMAQMAENGWICVAAEYRLSPGATFPDHIIDCKRALCWVKENIGDYGGNADFIVVTGGSAGGHLSALLALSANAPEFQPGFEDKNTAVQGCIPFYGFYDFLNLKQQRTNLGVETWVFSKLFKKTQAEAPALWKSGCPATWASDKAPPFLIIHGECDTLVPCTESRNLYEVLQEKSASAVAYAELPDAQHAFDIPLSLRTQIVVNYLTIYLAELHRRYREPAQSNSAEG